MNLFVAKDICWLKNCISAKLPNFCCEGKVIKNIKILEEMQKLPEVERLRIICKVAVVMADENVEPGQFGKRKHNDTIDGLLAKYESGKYFVRYATELTELAGGQKLVRLYDPSGNLIEVRTPFTCN